MCIGTVQKLNNNQRLLLVTQEQNHTPLQSDAFQGIQKRKETIRQVVYHADTKPCLPAIITITPPRSTHLEHSHSPSRS